MGRNKTHTRHQSGRVMEPTLLICHLVGALRATAKLPQIGLPWKEHWFLYKKLMCCHSGFG